MKLPHDPGAGGMRTVNEEADELDLVKQLLAGTIFATYEVANLDTGIIEPGLTIDAAFEKQWQLMLPHLEHLIAFKVLDGRLEEAIRAYNITTNDSVMVFKEIRDRIAELRAMKDSGSNIYENPELLG